MSLDLSAYTLPGECPAGGECDGTGVVGCDWELCASYPWTCNCDRGYVVCPECQGEGVLSR